MLLYFHSVSWLQVRLSADCTKNISWSRLSPLQRWGHLTMAFTDKFLYIAHHFIFVPQNAFGLGVNREWWWFEHPVSCLRVWLSAEASENVSWPTLSPLRGWGNFIMAFTGKFVYVAHHLILLRFIPFGIGVARSGWYVEYSLLWLCIWLSTGGAKKTFRGSRYFHSKEGVVGLWHLLPNLYV